MTGYLGAKGGSGVYQAIINIMPPHDTYIEAFLGTGAVMRKKAPAQRNIGLDLNQDCIDAFCGQPAELYRADALEYLQHFDFDSSGRTVVYLDPPYVQSTRTSAKRYAHELTDDQHRGLIEIALNLDCYVIFSGYRNAIYDDLLADWWSMDFQAMSRGGVRTETVWANFQPGTVHYHTYAGKDFTDRQRIKRKASRWAKNFAALPAGERQAILAALLQISDAEA